MPAHVTIGGRDLVVAPLTLKFVRMLTEGGLLDTIQRIKGLPTGKQIDAIVEVVMAGVSKHQPDVTKAWLEDNLEPAEIPGVLVAILTASGMESKPSGEAQGQ